VNNQNAHKHLRRYNSYFGTFNTNYNFLINPWIPALWSFTFPGFGHFLLGMYIEGYLLVIWEIIVNTKSHLNEAMMLSFIGKFEAAKHVLNIKWSLLYAAVFVYSALDSYHSAVVTNELHVLAEKEKEVLIPFKLTAFGFNYLEKYKPNKIAIWSLLMPGLGHMLIHRIPTGIFILVWWIILSYQSGVPLAGFYTLTGHFDSISSVLRPQWFLFIPSLYCFSIYDSYFYSVELNKLFKVEQANFLTRKYQNKNFKLPRKKRKLYGE
jgi:hypothetical protein